MNKPQSSEETRLLVIIGISVVTFGLLVWWADHFLRPIICYVSNILDQTLLIAFMAH